jgi:short subunit fatty acids transporter
MRGVLMAKTFNTFRSLYKRTQKSANFMTKTGMVFDFALVVGAVVAISIFPSNKISDYGSIFAAGFVAVIWFYNGLQLQSKQLDEQREQFQLEFNNLKM